METLASFAAWDWGCILTAWVCLALVVGVSLGRGIKAADEQRPAPEPTPEPEVNWLPFLPPVPRPEVDLLADQPLDVWLTPELSDRLFDELIAIEGLQ